MKSNAKYWLLVTLGRFEWEPWQCVYVCVDVCMRAYVLTQLCAYIHTYMFAQILVSGCTCLSMSEKKNWISFLQHGAPCFLRQILLLGPMLSQAANLADQCAPGTHLSLPPQCWVYKHTWPCLTMCLGCRYWTQVLLASVLPTESCNQPTSSPF